MIKFTSIWSTVRMVIILSCLSLESYEVRCSARGHDRFHFQLALFYPSFAA